MTMLQYYYMPWRLHLIAKYRTRYLARQWELAHIARWMAAFR